MNRILKSLGIVFLALLVAVAAAAGYGAYWRAGFDASSRAYAEQAVRTISANWSAADVMALAAPELKATLREEELRDTLLTLAHLGRLRQYQGANGAAEISYSTRSGRVVSASYVATATFENAAAEIQLRLVEVDGQWKLREFFFKPSLLRANA